MLCLIEDREEVDGGLSGGVVSRVQLGDGYVVDLRGVEHSSFNAVEKYYIYEEAYIDNQLNDRSTVTPNIIFNTILRNTTPTTARQ
jgi:hypothetical protein